MEWLFRSEFDAITTVALWSIAAVVVTTIVLFVYTIGLQLMGRAWHEHQLLRMAFVLERSLPRREPRVSYRYLT